MSRYHFHLRADGAIHRDSEGTECPDLVAAHEHAVAVASELMKHTETKTRHWSLCVCDERDERVLDVYFPDIDKTIGHLPPEMQMLVAQTCRRYGAFIDMLHGARATVMESRMLLARARRRPLLVCANGRPS